MAEPKIAENTGTLELQPDGTLAFRNWHIDADGSDNPELTLLDAVIRLLQEKRAECAETPPELMVFPLR